MYVFGHAESDYDHPFALVSGVSPDNGDRFLPYVDDYLVASEIETVKCSGILVPE